MEITVDMYVDRIIVDTDGEVFLVYNTRKLFRMGQPPIEKATTKDLDEIKRMYPHARKPEEIQKVSRVLKHRIQSIKFY
jgi:hypothetical protein